ncbi:MAG: thiopurine S-methyltransferase [Thioalkalispiraceae bacterium]|jgi:thiopurine S-methyltransferase
MEPEFWQQRWQDNKIGFHLDEVNSYLIKHWQSLGIEPGARVLVPLCGKSVDLCWLSKQGYRVEGVEISKLAIEQFFTEQGLPIEQEESDGWLAYRSGSIRIWCGDFFKLNSQQLGPVDAIYDRAALIALPHLMRSTYVRKLLELAGVAPQLLITLEYDQSQMSGPPFAVSRQEVNELYQSSYGEVSGPVEKIDVLPSHEHFAQRGVTALSECVYLLQVSKK